MNIINTKINGVYVIEPTVFTDERGSFVKPFSKDVFQEKNLVTNFEENFFSFSKKDVIRGMHFQTPPHDHIKLIYVPKGKILDVVLDLRKESPTYGQHVSKELSEANKTMMYIPRGCAHGFLSLEEDSCTMYLQETIRNAESENGIHFNSFGMNWTTENPIVSTRDQEFCNLSEFKSPF